MKRDLKEHNTTNEIFTGRTGWLQHARQKETAYHGPGNYSVHCLHNPDPSTHMDIWVLPLEGDRKPFIFFQSAANDTLATFSPDGHWVAYESAESGTQETYVQSFP